jgi:hypothetical protein
MSYKNIEKFFILQHLTIALHSVQNRSLRGQKQYLLYQPIDRNKNNIPLLQTKQTME